MTSETTAAEARFLEGPRPRGSELLWALGTFVEFIRGFRRPLTDFLHGPLEAMGLIDPVDADRIIVTDTAAEAVAAIREVAIPGFGLRYRPPKHHWFLRE